MRRVRVDKVISDFEWMATSNETKPMSEPATEQAKEIGVEERHIHTYTTRKRNKFMAINHTLHTHQHTLSLPPVRLRVHR